MIRLRVLYWISAKDHLRMLSPLPERDDVVQAVVLPAAVSDNKLQIKNTYKYKKISDINGIIEKFNPDVFVQYSSSREMAKFLKNKGIKHVLSTHGVWPESNLNKLIVSDKFFLTFDLICGASYKIKNIFTENSDPNTKVVTDVLAQFDILYNLQFKAKELRRELVGSASKLVVFFGHGITKKTDKLRPYDNGYYQAAIELSKLAEKNNWMVYVKPKSNKGPKLPSNKKNFKVLQHDADSYKYFCSDLIITSARSTIEVEAALVKKPIVRIYTPTTPLTDEQKSYEYGALDFGADYLVNDISKLERIMLLAFNDDNNLYKQQDKFIEHLGITFDGLAHIRFVNAIKDYFQKK